MAAGGGETKTIVLGDAGTVTINVDVRWLDLPDETFTALRRGIRSLEALATQAPTSDAADVDDVADTEEDVA